MEKSVQSEGADPSLALRMTGYTSAQDDSGRCPVGARQDGMRGAGHDGKRGARQDGMRGAGQRPVVGRRYPPSNHEKGGSGVSSRQSICCRAAGRRSWC